MDFCWKAVLEGKNPTKVGFFVVVVVVVVVVLRVLHHRGKFLQYTILSEKVWCWQTCGFV